MKSLYLTTVVMLFSIITNAQIYSNNFDQPVSTQFLEDGEQFFVNQHSTNLVIFSQGHGEWINTAYIFNNGETAAPISITGTDTIYVRAKAEYESTARPYINIGFSDANGAMPNNDLYNAQNRMTLSNEWQVFKLTVPNFNMTYGGPNDPLGTDMDSTAVTKIVFSPNAGFASQSSNNADGILVDSAFIGTIYIDYVSIGAPETSGVQSTTGTSFVETFNTDVSSNLIVADAFTSSITDGKLSITSEGHDQWDVIRYTIPNQVIDITENPRLSFTATAEKASSYTGPIGVMVVAVDDRGGRIEYPGLFVLQDLNNESKTFAIEFTEFRYEGNRNRPVNAQRIAYLDILINPGFAEFPQQNDAGVSVNAAFEGVIHIEEIRLGSAVSGLSNARVETLAFYPNPAQNHLILEGKFAGAEYNIYNTAGLTMQSGRVENEMLSIGELEKGLYVMVVTNSNGQRYTSQFVKE